MPVFYTLFQGEQGARQQMKLVVVGGQARKVGKTSVITGLIRGLSTFAWTAVKISHHEDDIGWQDTPSADELPGSATNWDVGPGLAPAHAAPRGTHTIDLGHYILPAHLDFLLTEEKDAQGRADTSLYLAAGARRALWLRARGGSLARALPALLEALESDEHVIMESNSIMSFFNPVLYLLVLDESREDFKASARHFLDRADAYITLRPDLEPRLWPGSSPQMLGGKPVFPVSVDEWSNSELCRFVSERLGPRRGASLM
jgi:hypothetical protein